MTTTKSLDTTELASKLGTNPRTLRKFLRSEGSPVTPVNKGNRYTVKAAQFRELRKAYNSWASAHTRLLEAS